MSLTGGKLLYIGGFETGEIAAHSDPLNSHASAVASSARARSGTYSALCPAMTYFNVPLGASITNFGCSFAFFLEDMNATEKITLFAPAATALPWLQIVGSGGTRKMRLLSGTRSGLTCWDSAIDLALDTWYVLNFYQYRQGGNDYWPTRVKLFSTDLATLHEDSGWQADDLGVSAGTTNLNSLFFGMINDTGSLAQTHNIHYDDIIIVQSSPAPTGPKVIGVKPTGDSATDDGFIGEDAGAATWDNVDDVPPDDATTYATSTGGSSSVQTYTHAAVTDPASSGNILGIGVYAKAARDAGSGTNFMARRIRTSGGFTGTFNNSVPSSSSDNAVWSWTRGYRDRSVSGSGWASGTGAEASIDDVEFGVTRTSAHGKITQALMEVAWGASWANSGNEKFYDRQKVRMQGVM